METNHLNTKIHFYYIFLLSISSINYKEDQQLILSSIPSLVKVAKRSKQQSHNQNSIDERSQLKSGAWVFTLSFCLVSYSERLINLFCCKPQINHKANILFSITSKRLLSVQGILCNLVHLYSKLIFFVKRIYKIHLCFSEGLMFVSISNSLIMT